MELKLAGGYKYLKKGLDQVSKYAKKLGRDTGYLLIFDPGSKLEWEKRGEVENVEHDDVKIVVLRV